MRRIHPAQLLGRTAKEMTQTQTFADSREHVPGWPQACRKFRKPLLLLAKARSDKGSEKMGRLRFELRTNRLKAECSTAELATPGGPCPPQGVGRDA